MSAKRKKVNDGSKTKSVIMTSVFILILIAIVVTVVLIAVNSGGINYNEVQKKYKSEYTHENVTVISESELSENAIAAAIHACERVKQFSELYHADREYTIYWVNSSSAIEYKTGDIYAVACEQEALSEEIGTILLYKLCDEYAQDNGIRIDKLMRRGVCAYLASNEYPKAKLANLEAYGAYKQYTKGNVEKISYCIAQYSITIKGHSISYALTHSDECVHEFLDVYAREAVQ